MELWSIVLKGFPWFIVDSVSSLTASPGGLLCFRLLQMRGTCYATFWFLDVIQTLTARHCYLYPKIFFKHNKLWCPRGFLDCANRVWLHSTAVPQRNPFHCWWNFFSCSQIAEIAQSEPRANVCTTDSTFRRGNMQWWHSWCWNNCKLLLNDFTWSYKLEFLVNNSFAFCCVG